MRDVRRTRAATQRRTTQADAVREWLTTDLRACGRGHDLNPAGETGRRVAVCSRRTKRLILADVEKLIGVLHRLVDAGHMIVVIEHHLDLINNGDHVIDLGPEGGSEGGEIVGEGTPEQIARNAESWTGKALQAQD